MPGLCDWGEASKVVLASVLKLVSHATLPKVGVAGTGTNGTFLLGQAGDRVTPEHPLCV